jgi:cellulose synthase/poly-beta-1,6-N-acetylglucosamine synthase-like glycosyltransferase
MEGDSTATVTANWVGSSDSYTWYGDKGGGDDGQEKASVLVGIIANNCAFPCIGELLDTLKKMEGIKDVVWTEDSGEGEDALRQVLAEAGQNFVKIDHRADNVNDCRVFARNLIREGFLTHEKKYTHLFFLDADVIPPADIIPRLLEHNKPICCGWYPSDRNVSFNRAGQQFKMRMKMPMVYGHIDGFSRELTLQRLWTLEDLTPARLEEVSSTGMGCALIRREVLEKIRFISDDSQRASEDTIFCKDARKAGYKTYVDTRLGCRHLHDKTVWRRPREPLYKFDILHPDLAKIKEEYEGG